ncbi:helix-turn-helix domain-containing protein [Chryseobacterium luquanense]|uniref:Helix-turn-helix domain-containing protein n=1 Tax=Chryseobacterium luquanense TaxID=2983766 RepID=A0ABT3Y894_9FLAO|nr:helix-turn-helix domain-containing protein [Chryseobacterium luquanense]MCX8534332.1 helix-turn-helix domain-containing protein [Chryseobacterium luquanense]
MSKAITFEQLPAAVLDLKNQISELKELIISQSEDKSNNKDDDDVLLNVEQAAKLLHLAVPTIYSKVSRGELPYMKNGKMIYFFKTELLENLRQNKVRSSLEIANAADAYFINKTRTRTKK